MNKLIIDGTAGKLKVKNDLNSYIPETFITHVHIFTIDGFKIRHELYIEDGDIKDWIGWDKPYYGCGCRCGLRGVF